MIAAVKACYLVLSLDLLMSIHDLASELMTRVSPLPTERGVFVSCLVSL